MRSDGALPSSFDVRKLNLVAQPAEQPSDRKALQLHGPFLWKIQVREEYQAHLRMIGAVAESPSREHLSTNHMITVENRLLHK